MASVRTPLLEETKKCETERKSEEGESERERGAREMTPGWETQSETLRNFVSCSKRDSVTDRDSVVILRAF